MKTKNNKKNIHHGQIFSQGYNVPTDLALIFWQFISQVEFEYVQIDFKLCSHTSIQSFSLGVTMAALGAAVMGKVKTNKKSDV